MSSEQVWRDKINKESDIHSTSGIIHPEGTHKSNNDNNTPIIIGLNKTTQKYGRRKRKTAQENIVMFSDKCTYLSMNDENAIALKYFELRTSAVWHFRRVNSCLRAAKKGRNM
jgi:co-chaperonin GroES (HSP10)